MSLLWQTHFAYSAQHCSDIKSHPFLEIAFAGRSNVGKSSAINTLTRNKRLAFSSKTPGRTQLINFFQMPDQNFLVDLPGYGYAAVPKKMRQHWQRELPQYLQSRPQLVGMVLIMDIRHPLQPLDQQMIDWFSITQKPIHILLSKVDKLSKSQAHRTQAQVQDTLQRQNLPVQSSCFSCLNKTGIATAEKVLKTWITRPLA